MPPPNRAGARVLLEACSRLACFVTAAQPPEIAEPGDTITGSYTLAKRTHGFGAGSRPSGWAVSMVVPPKEVKEPEEEAKAEEASEDPTAPSSFAEAVRAVQISQLHQLAMALKKMAPSEGGEAKAPPADEEPTKEGQEKAQERAEKRTALQARYDEMLTALQAECTAAKADEQMLTLMSSHLSDQESACGRKDAAMLTKLVAAAEEVVALLDVTALAAAFGVAIDKDDKEQAKQRKKDEAKKKALVVALHTKALALADLHALDAAAHPLAALDAAVAALHKWAAHSEHVKLTCRWHKAHGRSATALSVLNETLGKEKKPPSKENLELKTELYDALGWSHWASLGKAVLHVKFPPGFPLVYKAL